MQERTPFPQVFWISNSIEILERVAYYGIYFGFGIYTGLNFLSLLIGAALSGVIYTTLYRFFRDGGHPENVWYILGGIWFWA